MSDVTVSSGREILKKLDRTSYFEQRVFALSPLGTFATSFCIFAVFAGSFVVASAFEGRTALSITQHGIRLSQDAGGAFTLALLTATALGMQRYARVADRLELIEHRARLQGGPLSASDFAETLPIDFSMIIATVVGLVFGVVAILLFGPHSVDPGNMSSLPTLSWFLVTTAFVSALFTRGLALTRAGSRMTRTFIDNVLVIDLLRTEQLNLVGRSAARTALIWFSVSAVMCLFFVGNGPNLSSVILVVVSAGLGIAIFVVTMEQVHKRIRAAKAVELERVRSQIEAVRTDAHVNADAALRLHGLIAYEARIASAPEWPFDQPTALRVGASALIVTLPWFGQAVAGTMIEHLGQVMH